MRALALSLSLLATLGLPAQGLVINEVQSACRTTIRHSDGSTPDWIEVYNPLHRSVSLQGMRLNLGDRTHVFEQAINVPAKGHLLLFADERLSEGADHLGFKLDRTGGTLLLVDRDGTTILDVFVFPSMTTDLSVGRTPDGARAWSYFTEPTPGAANIPPGSGPVQAMAPRPVADLNNGRHPGPRTVLLTSPAGCTVRYTLDGAHPGTSSALTANGPIGLEHTSTLRALCQCPGQLDSPELVRTYRIGALEPLGIALTLDPKDLWDPATGIYVDGLQGNFSKGGMEWERMGQVEIAQGEAMPVGVRISGSGSRGRPKRSFKLHARDRYASPDSIWTMPDGTRCDEMILRADATPHATLHNLLLEAVVRRFGLEVAVQPSRVLPLHLNGSYWGSYRAMPPKDAQWLRQLAGAEAVDVVDGPAHAALSGSNDHFLRARQHLMDRAPVDSIAAYLELTSLYDLAALDAFTGRADHDLNVRAYRPRLPGGRWRWVLFDMDLWSGVDDNCVERMCSATQPETPFLPQLLAHPELQPGLLARITALNATALHPTTTLALLDSLGRAHGPALQKDRARWASEMEVPDPASTLHELRTFVEQRGTQLLEHLAGHTGRSVHRIRFDVPPVHQGRVLLDGLPLPPGKHDVPCLSGIPARITLLPASGFEGRVGRMELKDGQLQLQDLSRSGSIRVQFNATLP